MDITRINNYLRVRRYFELALIIILLPLFITIFILAIFFTYLSGIKNVLFKQERFSLDQKKIKIFKIRTLKEDGNFNTTTKISIFLRKHRIDEIPQIINIIKGEFSLIGPRSEPIEYHNQIAKNFPEYNLRYIITPGLTGFAQTYQGHTENLEDAKKKLELDLYYINNISLSFDLKILFKTCFVLISGSGAK